MVVEGEMLEAGLGAFHGPVLAVPSNLAFELALSPYHHYVVVVDGAVVAGYGQGVLIRADLLDLNVALNTRG